MSGILGYGLVIDSDRRMRVVLRVVWGYYRDPFPHSHYAKCSLKLINKTIALGGGPQREDGLRKCRQV